MSVEARISELNEQLRTSSRTLKQLEDALREEQAIFTALWREKDALERSLIPPRRLSRNGSRPAQKRTPAETATHLLSDMTQPEFDAFIAAELAKRQEGASEDAK